MRRRFFIRKFEGQANQLVGRYGAPVYLVGSMVRGVEEPRDIDLVVILSDSEMARLYGHDFPKRTEAHGELATWEWRRMRDNIKQSRSLRNWGGLPIDFKVQSELEALAYSTKPRYRLDTAPAWVFLDERYTNYETRMVRELVGLPLPPLEAEDDCVLDVAK